MTLAEAHIELQARLRRLTSAGVAALWASLPAYDEGNVDEWLTKVLPIVAAAQRQSVSLTEGYLARALERQPIGADADQLIGAAVRNGVAPEEVYRRPFVTAWTALKNGTVYDDAIAAGLARATSTAEMDVQLSHRGTLAAVGREDDRIRGFRRVTDGNACVLCRMASTQRYHKDALMPIHNHCGCTVAPLTDTDPDGHVVDRDLLAQLKGSGEAEQLAKQQKALRARKREADQEAARDDVALDTQDHGELGPVLVNGNQHFTSEHELH